jgi:hypothetical protein
MYQKLVKDLKRRKSKGIVPGKSFIETHYLCIKCEHVYSLEEWVENDWCCLTPTCKGYVFDTWSLHNVLYSGKFDFLGEITSGMKIPFFEVLNKG